MKTNFQQIKGSPQSSRYAVVEATDGKGVLELFRVSPGKKGTSGSGDADACNA
ncbi:MAG TPA: hypothetical protein VFQ97_05515 [Gallionella sp.]|nr:hypothetical protein [Gallionella sp.]